MPIEDNFNWLHLTDLHYGFSGQRPLWPNVRTAFFDDLAKLHDRCGPWHAVLFTGDLVQTGKKEEFQALEDEVLARLWDHLRQLGSGGAVLLAVPGNHDLVRPDAKKPTPAVRWLLANRFLEIQEEFWTEPDSDYRQVVAAAFSNYAAWWGRTAFRPGKSVPIQKGLLPGDFAVTLQTGPRHIGIVGLNTTFLQLAGGDYQGRLAWDLAQLEAVCGTDMSDWFGTHDCCLLLTHQGPEWLNQPSQQEVYSEINPAGRFAAHLFGHMHKTVVRSTSLGGSKPLRQWQTCSLFGLERFGEPPQTDRRHGYGLGRVEFSAARAAIRFWPRLATRDANGWRFIPHHESCVLLDDEGTPPDEVGEMRRVSATRSQAAGRPIYEEITKSLALGFIKTIRQLVEIDSATSLRPKAAKIQGWLSAPETPRDSERCLAEALARTIDELRQVIKSEFADRILGYLNEAESDPAIPQMVAAATLEMTREDTTIAPQYLIRQMRIQEVHRVYFSSFLYSLRRHLTLEQGYSEAISYANELAGAGALEGFANSIAASLDHLARIEAMLAFQLKSRRLSESFRSAIANYLSHLREHQLVYAPLPLVRAGAQDRSGARIKDIFVPIAVRSKIADRSGDKQGTRRTPEEVSSRQSDTDLGALLLSAGRVVLLGPPGSGKTTVLKRTALVLAEGRSEEIPGWGDAPGAIPISLRLRSLAAYLQTQDARFFEACPASTIAYLEHYYREEQRVSLTPDFFDRLLDKGGCAVFMDGLDEVPVSQRVEVAKHVEAFIVRYGVSPNDEKALTTKDRDVRGNVFVLSSRPKGFEPVEFFLRSAAVAVCETKPLEPVGIRQLVNNLLTIIELDKNQRAKDFVGLCDAIFRETNLLILAGTPLFCTSLVLMYKYHGAELPQRRIDVFAEIVDLLLGFWKAQDQKVIESGRVDDDGTGMANVDLSTAVKMKKRRLDHIALHMQMSEKRTEIDFVSLVRILSAYLVEKERAPAEQATALAERFLVTSHERSGLLVETEPSDPPIYAFTHEGFREYLVADALANLGETRFISTILGNIDNPTWEEVIILAGAHSGISDYLRECLLEECVKAANACKLDGNADGWARRLAMAGRMAHDMGEYLSPRDRAKLKEILREAMADSATQLKHRLGVALSLDDLGWLTDTLFAFVPIPATGTTQFCIGKTPVANVQYQRFLTAEDFGDAALWADPICIDLDGRVYHLDAGNIPGNGTERLPKSWNDPKFGIAHRGLPIVGISWFEAAAYCRWLQRHWDELEEARTNPGVRPRSIRLPTEDEWCLAVFGSAVERQFPWEPMLGPQSVQVMDLTAYANIGKTLDCTSPIGSFPQGASRPFGVIDFCGNVWEWQVNLYDFSRRGIALRGGAYTTELEDCAADLRGWRDPAGRDSDIGFRVLIET